MRFAEKKKEIEVDSGTFCTACTCIRIARKSCERLDLKRDRHIRRTVWLLALYLEEDRFVVWTALLRIAYLGLGSVAGPTAAC